MKDDPDITARLGKVIEKWDVRVSEPSVSREDGKLRCVMNVKTTSTIQEINKPIASEPDIYSLEFRAIE